MQRKRYGKWLCLLVSTAVVSGAALADVRNAAPIQGGTFYAVPYLAVYAFGLLGLVALIVSYFCQGIRRVLFVFWGTGLVLFQYVVIMFDLGNYPEAFVWYDAFVLAPYVVVQAEAYGSGGTILGLALPCVFIIVSTLAIPIAVITCVMSFLKGKSPTGQPAEKEYDQDPNRDGSED